MVRRGVLLLGNRSALVQLTLLTLPVAVVSRHCHAVSLLSFLVFIAHIYRCGRTPTRLHSAFSPLFRPHSGRLRSSLARPSVQLIRHVFPLRSFSTSCQCAAESSNLHDFNGKKFPYRGVELLLRGSPAAFWALGGRNNSEIRKNNRLIFSPVINSLYK